MSDSSVPQSRYPMVRNEHGHSGVDSIHGQREQTLSSHGSKLMRLTFHDCVGGCDGVVDSSQHGNEGLDIPINQLQGIISNSLHLECQELMLPWLRAAATLRCHKQVEEDLSE